MTFYLDVLGIIHHFGGAEAMATKGWGLRAIEKCRERERISTKHLLYLKALAAERGISFSVDQFIKRRKPK